MVAKQIYIDCTIDEVEAAPEYDQVKVPMEAVISGLIEDEDNCANVIKEVLKRMRDNEWDLVEMLILLLKNYLSLEVLDEEQEDIIKLTLKTVQRIKKQISW